MEAQTRVKGQKVWPGGVAIVDWRPATCSEALRCYLSKLQETKYLGAQLQYGQPYERINEDFKTPKVWRL